MRLWGQGLAFESSVVVAGGQGAAGGRRSGMYSSQCGGCALYGRSIGDLQWRDVQCWWGRALKLRDPAVVVRSCWQTAGHSPGLPDKPWLVVCGAEVGRCWHRPCVFASLERLEPHACMWLRASIIHGHVASLTVGVSLAHVVCRSFKHTAIWM